MQPAFGSMSNQAVDISFDVAAVIGPIASLSWLEDAGLTFESTRSGRKLRRKEEIEILRRDGVSAETVLILCPFSAHVDDEAARLVRSKKVPVIPDDGTRGT